MGQSGSGRSTGSLRGGPGGPCDHCFRTNSPCWRKGPPEKPLLCNACGAHYLVKKSLDGYKPGQKGTRSPKGNTSKRSKGMKETTGENFPKDHLSHSEVCPSTTTSSDTQGNGKRARRENKRYTPEQDNDKNQRKPKALQVPLTRQDSDVSISNTPMAVSLLADMADRRKKRAPPPVWELRSPRSAEQKSFQPFKSEAKSEAKSPVEDNRFPSISSFAPEAAKEAAAVDREEQNSSAQTLLKDAALSSSRMPAAEGAEFQSLWHEGGRVGGPPQPPLREPHAWHGDASNPSAWTALSPWTSFSPLPRSVAGYAQDAAARSGPYCIKGAAMGSPVFPAAVADFQRLLAGGVFEPPGRFVLPMAAAPPFGGRAGLPYVPRDISRGPWEAAPPRCTSDLRTMGKAAKPGSKPGGGQRARQ
uniref:GATA-type domain-containing protein n=1 Tax=Tetraselmis sp. GSL018 TaxID=582737 RepID=A0A061R989_9CHLO|eukprot:CAMPEP_0177596938 /NCGR_PEP_ID=MMETSP0419_2-20121207/11416_1 /TAXON_ID=582737 /ORGANISM="Tetraselmis sp., Strain GSL018" /LENGTH=416 /DNA_ID=CAMNT_0019089017 /DNA_START=892 /DNA_END=2142 /DNA_ORIENTATION=+